MNTFSKTISMLAFALSASALAHADVFPYENRGQIAPTTIIHATETGDLMGFYIPTVTGGEDKIRLHDVTAGTYSSYILDNRTSYAGEEESFGHVNAGDELVFEIWNSDVAKVAPDFVMASDPRYSSDRINHFYIATIDGRVYVGGEDNSIGVFGTDYTYNDLQSGLIYEQVTLTPGPTTAQTPEPSSLALLGTGLLTAVGVMRRRTAGTAEAR